MTVLQMLAAAYHSKGSGRCLRPASAHDEVLLAQVPIGRALAVTISLRPPPKARQFYWALLAKLVEAGCYGSRDEAHFDVRLKTGRAASLIMRLHPDGSTAEVRLTPASTTEWDGAEWRAFLDDVVAVVLKDVLPGMGLPGLRAEVEQFCGVRLRDALEEGGDRG